MGKRFPRLIQIQFTYEEAVEQYGDDSDSNIYAQIGNSRETIEIKSWKDIPDGYEPVDEDELEEYGEWKENNY